MRKPTPAVSARDRPVKGAAFLVDVASAAVFET
jgi:hypothetical protein